MALAAKQVLKFGNVLSTLKKASARTYFTYVNEPSQPLPGKEPKWVTAENAFEDLKSDICVFCHGAAATPLKLLDGMVKVGKVKKLKNITVCHMHLEGPGPHCDPSCEGIFRSMSFFVGGNSRKALADGRADFIPIFLHDIPKTFEKKILQPMIALISVCPPDKHGYCSFGTSVDCVRSAVKHSKIIIAQVNKQMPRTFGDGIIHISHLDYAVEVDDPLPEGHGDTPPSPEEDKIAKLIAEHLVVDGATLQMGIGTIPNAVLSCLTNHKNLGVHSEMFADGIVSLVNKGCITNSEKKINNGKIIGSFTIGSKELYDFVDNNPYVEMLRVDYVNSPYIISRQPKMTAINSAIEIDITGQVCADSMGTRIYSGFGGQLDFIHGAAEGFDGEGKPILAMLSRTKKGVGKIVLKLQPGAGVVTSRGHIQYLVTEYGIACFFGKSIRQRAHALIQVAHPDDREALEKGAFERLKCMPSP